MLYKIHCKRILLSLLIASFTTLFNGCQKEEKKDIAVIYPKSNKVTFNHPYIDKANCYYRINYDSAIFYYKKAATQFLNEKNWEGVTKAFNLIGNGFIIKQANDSALYYLLRGKNIADHRLPPNNITRFRNDYYLGICYGNMLQPKVALSYIQNCENLLKNYFIPDHPAWADVYATLGELYSSSNIHKAEEYYTKALITNHRLGAKIADLGENFYVLASTYRKKGDYFKALQYNKAAFNYFKKAGLGCDYLANCYVAEGNIYHDMDSSQMALKSYRKAIRLKKRSDNINWEIYFNDLACGFIQSNQTDSAKHYVQQSLNYNPGFQNANWFILGRAFCLEKKWDSAELYYRKSLSLRLKALEKNNAEIISSLFYLGNLYSEKGCSDSALSYYQQALCLSVNRWSDAVNPLSNPPDTLIKEGSVELLNLFYAKGLELEKKYNRNKKQPSFLEGAFNCFMLANYIIELNRKSYQENESKLFLVSSYRKVYDHAINCAYYLNLLFPDKMYAAHIFDIMEKTKYALLLEDLFEAGKNKTSGELNKEEPEEKIAMRSNQHALDLTGTQRLLKNNQEILEYYWGDTSAFVMGITRNKTIVYQIYNSNVLEDSIKSYIQLLENDSPDPRKSAHLKRLNEYAHISHFLYSNLVEKVLITDVETIGEPTLIITPDGLLSFIPFESFTTKAPHDDSLNYKTLSYLIKHYHVTYSYSSTILFSYLKKRNNEIKSKPLFLGLFDGKAGNLTMGTPKGRNIASSGDKDFRDIAQAIGKYDVATMENLVIQLPNHEVIQLNVHGIADDKDPSLNKLMLKDKDLYFSNVMDMDFRNKILLLTACETGIGRHYKGEGVYSLARGFIYAGASSVIMSLWKIPQNPTLSLMDDFYASLLSGKSTDLALTLAKRSYLDKSDNNTANPCFWTGLVSVGNLKPVYCTTQANYRNTIVVCSVIMVLSIFLYIRSTRFC